MRLLIFSDLQLDNYRQGSKIIDGNNNRLLHGLAVLKEIGDYAKENKIDYVVSVGDHFERRHFVEVSVVEEIVPHLNYIAENVKEEFFIVLGNHDFEDDRCLHNIIAPLKLNSNIVVFTEDSCKYHHIIAFHFFPFGKHAQNRIINTQLESKFINIAFVHDFINGEYLNPNHQIISPITPELFKNYDAAFFGHVHKHQVIQEQPPIVVVGSPMQLEKGDVGEKRGFLDVTIDVGARQISWKLIETKAPKFVETSLNTWKKEFEKLKNNFVMIKSNKPVPELDEVAEYVFYEPEYEENKSEARIQITQDMTDLDVFTSYLDYVNPNLDKVKLIDLAKEMLE